jgi:hypothetical protein
MATNPDLTVIGLKQSNQHAHCGCFPRAVRADQAEDFPAFDGQVDAIDSGAFCKGFAQVADFNDRAHGSTTRFT